MPMASSSTRRLRFSDMATASRASVFFFPDSWRVHSDQGVPGVIPLARGRGSLITNQEFCGDCGGSVADHRGVWPNFQRLAVDVLFPSRPSSSIIPSPSWGGRRTPARGRLGRLYRDVAQIIQTALGCKRGPASFSNHGRSTAFGGPPAAFPCAVVKPKSSTLTVAALQRAGQKHRRKSGGRNRDRDARACEPELSSSSVTAASIAGIRVLFRTLNDSGVVARWPTNAGQTTPGPSSGLLRDQISMDRVLLRLQAALQLVRAVRPPRGRYVNRFRAAGRDSAQTGFKALPGSGQICGPRDSASSWYGLVGHQITRRVASDACGRRGARHIGAVARSAHFWLLRQASWSAYCIH